ncbi:hypothetical protein [Nocardioides sp. KR10-350]|uniref:hypothetical protein n=1 Tax=Nocardioides cheoyonin TaxID=3156615 RepID=UPI0032B423CA
MSIPTRMGLLGFIATTPQARYAGPDGLVHSAPSTFEDLDAAIAWLRSERRLLEE